MRGGTGPEDGIENTVGKSWNFGAAVAYVILVAVIQNYPLRVAEGEDGAVAVIGVPVLDGAGDRVVSVQVIECYVELQVPRLEPSRIELGMRRGGEEAVLRLLCVGCERDLKCERQSGQSNRNTAKRWQRLERVVHGRRQG